MKCIIIIDKDLPVGLIANTAAVLGMNFGRDIEGGIGKDLEDLSGRNHKGITNIPIPILSLSKDELKVMYDNILDTDDQEIIITGFNKTAQTAKNYNDYETKLLKLGKNDIEYLGFSLYGPKKKINKLTGNLKMLR